MSDDETPYAVKCLNQKSVKYENEVFNFIFKFSLKELECLFEIKECLKNLGHYRTLQHILFNHFCFKKNIIHLH